MGRPRRCARGRSKKKCRQTKIKEFVPQNTHSQTLDHEFDGDASREVMCEATQPVPDVPFIVPRDLRRNSRVWGQLLSTVPNQSTIDLISDAYSIGRDPSCDIVVTGLSKKHCTIIRDTEASHGLRPVFIEDNSTNGTFVNEERLERGKRLLLQSGDTVSFVSNVLNRFISYCFNDMNRANSIDSEHKLISRLYDIRETVGSGSFSLVRLAVNRKDGRRFAVKIIDKRKFWHLRQVRKQLLGEVDLLRTLKHPHIIEVEEILDSERFLYIVMEYISGGTLFDRVTGYAPFSEGQAQEVFRQMLEGLDYLHNRSISHRDLKPENILLSGSFDQPLVKISDFGIARIVGEKDVMTTVCGTPSYAAPEVLLRQQGGAATEGYGKAVDMWGAGVILYMILSGEPPFSSERPISLFQQITTADFEFNPSKWSKISQHAKSFVERLLRIDATQRLSVSEALSHQWLDEDHLGQKRRKVYDLRSSQKLKHDSSFVIQTPSPQCSGSRLSESFSFSLPTVPYEASCRSSKNCDGRNLTSSEVYVLAQDSEEERNASQEPWTPCTPRFSHSRLHELGTSAHPLVVEETPQRVRQNSKTKRIVKETPRKPQSLAWVKRRK